MGAILCERGAVLRHQAGSPVRSPTAKVESSVARDVADSLRRIDVATSSYLERLESGT